MLLTVTPPELKELLISGLRSRLDFIKRTKLAVYVSADDKFKILSGLAARNYLGQLGEISSNNKKAIRLVGSPAMPGRAIGRARLIFYNKDFYKFKPGEILVAYQTMVHYLPLMKKAKAVVTEFGGLTSHAAVVSRELKIPCIVGINNLTISLKDGDLVEVDATSGVVRKL